MGAGRATSVHKSARGSGLKYGITICAGALRRASARRFGPRVNLDQLWSCGMAGRFLAEMGGDMDQCGVTFLRGAGEGAGYKRHREGSQEDLPRRIVINITIFSVSADTPSDVQERQCSPGSRTSEEGAQASGKDLTSCTHRGRD